MAPAEKVYVEEVDDHPNGGQVFLYPSPKDIFMGENATNSMHIIPGDVPLPTGILSRDIQRFLLTGLWMLLGVCLQCGLDTRRPNRICYTGNGCLGLFPHGGVVGGAAGIAPALFGLAGPVIGPYTPGVEG